MRRVTVTWTDPYRLPDAWVDPGDLEDVELFIVESRGYLVRKTRDLVVIAGAVGRDGQLSNVDVIPVGCVIRIR